MKKRIRKFCAVLEIDVSMKTYIRSIIEAKEK